jgi:hypothetical protein
MNIHDFPKNFNFWYKILKFIYSEILFVSVLKFVIIEHENKLSSKHSEPYLSSLID